MLDGAKQNVMRWAAVIGSTVKQQSARVWASIQRFVGEYVENVRRKCAEFGHVKVIQDGILYTLLRRTFGALSILPILVHELFKLLVRRVAGRSRWIRRLLVFNGDASDETIKYVAIEWYVILFALANWLVLRRLAGPLSTPGLVALTLVPIFRLGDTLHFLFERHLPHVRQKLSVGRSLVLLGVNYLEILLIFASLYIANSRIPCGHSVGRIPQPLEAFVASAGVVVGKFDHDPSRRAVVPNGLLVGIEFAVGLFVLIVVLVRILEFRKSTELTWSTWLAWDELATATVPKGPGVYEVRRADAEERLTIEKATNLRRRIVRGLVMGKLPHSAGKRIRADERVGEYVVRWAETDRPAAAEEELHRRHVQHFGSLPQYTQRT